MQSRKPEPPPPPPLLRATIALSPQSIVLPSLEQLRLPGGLPSGSALLPLSSSGSSTPSTVDGSVSSDGSPRRSASRALSLSPRSVLAPHVGASQAQRAQYWSTVLTEKLDPLPTPTLSKAEARGISRSPRSSPPLPQKARSLIANMTLGNDEHTPPPSLRAPQVLMGAVRKRGRFQCHLCTATFAQRGDMMRHIRVKGGRCTSLSLNGQQHQSFAV